MAKGRIVIGMLGLDQHELGAVALARVLRDAGMEVIYAGRFNTPQSIVQTAIDEDVDVIGISCHSWEFIGYMAELMAFMAEKGANIPVVLGGSIITAADAERMRQQGAAAVFGSGSGSDEIVKAISELASTRQARMSVR
jgi:methylmalonyl-CoA mutase C-terminal domain/subunit